MEVRALVPTGYGLNCDYETDYSLNLAGARSYRVHINEIIKGEGERADLKNYHIIAFGGGFSWGDDHGAGVILACKLRFNLWERLMEFVYSGGLIIGICNGFQALVNLGLLPAIDMNYGERRVAIIGNDHGNFIDTWVNLRINPDSPCVFTRGISQIELCVRHGEGKFYAKESDIERLFENNQVVMQYADRDGAPANGRWPENPNGSLKDIAGICDPTGRIFGLMPHPEAYNHFTNHPDWTRRYDMFKRKNIKEIKRMGEGVNIFKNAVDYIKSSK